MDNQRKKISEFSEFLNEEVMGTVEQNLSFLDIKGFRKILVFQSTAVWIVDGVIEQLLQNDSKVKIIVLGRDDCRYMQDKYENSVKQIVNEYDVDALLFFNNFVNCVDFSNVEHVAMFVEKQIPVYSYSYVQREFNRHNNIAKHIYGEILYKDLLEWYKTIR